MFRSTHGDKVLWSVVQLVSVLVMHHATRRDRAVCGFVHDDCTESPDVRFSYLDERSRVVAITPSSNFLRAYWLKVVGWPAGECAGIGVGALVGGVAVLRAEPSSRLAMVERLAASLANVVWHSRMVTWYMQGTEQHRVGPFLFESVEV